METKCLIELRDEFLAFCDDIRFSPEQLAQIRLAVEDLLPFKVIMRYLTVDKSPRQMSEMRKMILSVGAASRKLAVFRGGSNPQKK